MNLQISITNALCLCFDLRRIVIDTDNPRIECINMLRTARRQGLGIRLIHKIPEIVASMDAEVELRDLVQRLS